MSKKTIRNALSSLAFNNRMRVINTINRDRMALAKYIVIKITKVDLRRRRRARRTHHLARIHVSAVDVHRR